MLLRAGRILRLIGPRDSFAVSAAKLGGTIEDARLATVQDAVRHRYIVARELGRSTPSIVYLAQETAGGAAVALRLIEPAAVREKGTPAFLRSLASLRRLEHSGLVAVLGGEEISADVPDSAQAPLLLCVTRFVDAESLRDRLRRSGPLPIETVLRIAHEMCDALSYAHGRNVLHGALSPEHIFLTQPHACLTDIGVAAAINELTGGDFTASRIDGAAAGYLSPEQLSGSRSIDGRTDLFSLGCVLHEMLAGTPPFTGTRRGTGRHGPPSLRASRSDVTARLQLIIERLLAPDPEDRYPSAASLSGALASSHEPLPPTGLRRFRWGRIAAGLGLLLAIIALGTRLAGLWR